MGGTRKKKQDWPFINFAKRENAWRVDARTRTGGSRRFFATRVEAETFAAICRTKRNNEGVAAFKFDERQRAEYGECLDLLAPYGATLRDAVSHYVTYLSASKKSIAAKASVKAFLASKEQDGMSARYLGDCRARLNRFAECFGETSLSAITAAELDAWLRALGVGVVTRNTFQRRLSALYEWARGLGYVSGFPLRGVRKAREPLPRPESLSADEASRLLASATDETLPFWALALFAGLRPESELKRLQWDGVNIASGIIVVPESDHTGRTKTGSRAVPIEANLRSWLEPYAARSGYVMPKNFRKLLDRDKRRAGFGKPGSETDAEKRAGVRLRPWVQDATRHSYGNYLLAVLEDVGKVAYRMGNSPNVVKRNYEDKDPSRQANKRAEAERFWNIRPRPAAEILPFSVVAA